MEIEGVLSGTFRVDSPVPSVRPNSTREPTRQYQQRTVRE